MTLLDILLKKEIIQEADVTLVQEKVLASGGSVEKILEEMGVAQEKIIEAKGEALGVPLRTLGDVKLSQEVMDYIPEESALHYKFAPLGVVDGVLEVGIVDPENIEARDALNFISYVQVLRINCFLFQMMTLKKY